MIDRFLMPVQKVLLAPSARALVALGATADRISVAGFALGVLGFGCLALGWFAAGLVLIAANRIADGLDGAVARLLGPTDRGAFIDIALDFVFYALVPLGFALADPASNALPAALLITAFVGTGSSFLAYASIAAKRGLVAEAHPSKGIYYLGGLTEGFETIAVFGLMCLWPAAFPWLAGVYAALCTITTLTRWYQGWVTFGPETATTQE